MFIRNVGVDMVSDLTTNILRGLLAQYTLEQCHLHSLKTGPNSNLGPVLSVENCDWEAKELHLPISDGRSVLLVPKFSVRRVLSLNSQEFWNHYMIQFLQREYLQAGGPLVRTFRSKKRRGEKYVTKKSVKEKHPFIKDDLASFVQKHPEILELYKIIKGAKGPLDNDDFEESFDEGIFAQALTKRYKRSTSVTLPPVNITP